MWGLFMTSSMNAVIHLEPRHAENLEVHKNSRFEEIQSLFDITKKLILENQEILNVNSIGSENPSWARSALLNDQAIKWTKARVHVYSDSVLCLGRINDPKEAMKRWTGQVAEFQMENSFEELLGLDGEPIEFEWNIFPGFTSLQILQKIHSDLEEADIKPEEFSDRIIFVSMFNDINVDKKEMMHLVPWLLWQSKITLPNSWKDSGHSWDPEKKESGCVGMITNQEEDGTQKLLKWCESLKSQDLPYSKEQTHWIVGSYGKRKTKTPFTTMENLQMWSSCFE